MNPLRAYAETQKATAPKERLMIMLFEAALGHIKKGATALETRDKKTATGCLGRAGARNSLSTSTSYI